MNLFRESLVVARRDFLSIVATPTFLLFLLAPLLMVGFATIGGVSAGQVVKNAEDMDRLMIIVPAMERPAFIETDRRLRSLMRKPPLVEVRDVASTSEAAIARWRDDGAVLAILTGTAANPVIAQRDKQGAAGTYLATLAEAVAREGLTGAADPAAASRPRFTELEARGPGKAARSALAYGAVFTLFLLTLLLAGQTVSMLAEEKGNKVIEILAAAIRLESVFFGKLLGMLGVALLFIGFWATLVGLGAGLVLVQAPADVLATLTLAPALGWPLFLILGLLYFLMAFLLLGAVFLGIGAQAGTVREIQLLSLPITFLQVGMFGLASAAANAPGTQLATIAQWLPWSSPFAMAARGATDASLWPHVVALGWQALWVAITIWLSVRIFRAGVLRSGGSWWPWGNRASAPVAEDRVAT
ncbi:ABC transporter permease [Sphingomonas lacunae]|uniref:ABC transporter permease n=1 Tax=Sphingomonas lacunae TaxID=2698828 RepID=A0A6M4ARP7_9SPHN|nr:ABC transporter permease [Sphingomonas lacunae]QJQ31703.1 ABC transporter permease [Sphingomonas lacunae]